MSTYHFNTNTKGTETIQQMRLSLDNLQNKEEIERWDIHSSDGMNIIQIVTNKLSPEEVKHTLRALGIDAEFTKAPEAG